MQTEEIIQRFNIKWSTQKEGSICGPGSTTEGAADLVREFPTILKTVEPKVVNDVGCGDMAWTKRIDWTGIDYLGYDIIERENLSLPFVLKDLLNEEIRDCDLSICKDVFIHMPNEQCLILLQKILKGSKWLVADTYRVNTNENRLSWNSIFPAYGYSPINLIIEPFDLGDPVLKIPQPKWNRDIGLWRI